MYYVHLIPFRGSCQTRLWFSDRVLKDVAEYRRKGDPNGAFWKRLERCALAGFPLHERGSQPAVRYEWDGVYRVGFVDSLFRLIGFYEDGTNKTEFITIDSFLKRGQGLSAAERNRVDEVARVKRDGDWEKVTNGGSNPSGGGRYPRLAR
jgi:hypothetical protein